LLTIVRDTILKYNMLQPDSQVIAAVSGGADSMAMLHCLAALGYLPVVVHVEHGIRGISSRADSDFVKQYCRERNIPFRLVSVDVPAYAAENKIGTEQAARALRYEALRDAAAELSCPIAVAHHIDDQAETVLLHLLRGSGLNGLCGMQPVADGIIRPLLFVCRKQIEAFCKENALPYVTDETNTDITYKRNRIRHELLPLLKEYNPDITASLSRTADLLQGDALLLEQQTETLAEKLLTQNENTIIIKANLLRNLPVGAQRRLIRKALTLLRGPQDIEQKHIEAVVQLLQGQSGKRLSICNGIGCKLSYNQLAFYTELPQKSAYCYPFLPNKTFLFGEIEVQGKLTAKMGRHTAHCEYLDRDKLPHNLQLRTRLEGDYIYPLGMTGRAKLKKYLIDRKIPSEQREKLVLLAHESEILAIIGLTVSRHAAVEQSSQNILKIVTREIN